MLTIAKDELKCALEDRTMFRGFTGTNNTGKESSFYISPIPTPPLGRTGKIDHIEIISKRKQTTPDDSEQQKYSLEWFQSKMREKSPSPATSSMSFIRHNSAPVGEASKNSGTCLMQQFERLQMADDANQQEKQELQISNKSERTKQKNIMNIDDLTRQLEDISKFSLEWFEIKREIEVIKRRRDRTKQQHSDFRRSI